MVCLSPDVSGGWVCVTVVLLTVWPVVPAVSGGCVWMGVLQCVGQCC